MTDKQKADLIRLINELHDLRIENQNIRMK